MSFTCDPQLERNVHRSQNRLESYHQLRAVIAQVAGKKGLSGRTDIDIEISAPGCSPRCEADQNLKALEMLKKTSPAAWRNIHMNGHYAFDGNTPPLDLDAIVAGLNLA